MIVKCFVCCLPLSFYVEFPGLLFDRHKMEIGQTVRTEEHWVWDEPNGTVLETMINVSKEGVKMKLNN